MLYGDALRPTGMLYGDTLRPTRMFYGDAQRPTGMCSRLLYALRESSTGLPYAQSLWSRMRYGDTLRPTGLLKLYETVLRPTRMVYGEALRSAQIIYALR